MKIKHRNNSGIRDRFSGTAVLCYYCFVAIYTFSFISPFHSFRPNVNVCVCVYVILWYYTRFFHKSLNIRSISSLISGNTSNPLVENCVCTIWLYGYAVYWPLLFFDSLKLWFMLEIKSWNWEIKLDSQWTVEIFINETHFHQIPIRLL